MSLAEPYAVRSLIYEPPDDFWWFGDEELSAPYDK
jgi:hypothetical protein